MKEMIITINKKLVDLPSRRAWEMVSMLVKYLGHLYPKTDLSVKRTAMINLLLDINASIRVLP